MKKLVLFLTAMAVVASFACTAFAVGNDHDKLVAVDEYDATSFDPINHNDVPSNRANSAVHEGPFWLDSKTFEIIPLLAEKPCEIIDGKEFIITLRKGVKFHNGDELTADDAVYSMKRAMKDGQKVRQFTKDIADVVKVDDYTYKIILNNPDYSFLSNLTGNWAMILNAKYTEAQGENYTLHPMGTGPFKFVSWEKNNKFVLERNDDYWGDKPKIKTLEIRAVPEPTSRAIQLETGDVDVAYPINPIDIKRVDDSPNTDLVRKPSVSTVYLGFNTKKAPFDNEEVRRAIRMAIDVEMVQQQAFQGVGKVPTTIVPESIIYSTQKETPLPEYNEEKAKEEAKRLGLEGKTFHIYTNENKQRGDMCQTIREYLAEMGVTLEIHQLEWAAFLDQCRKGEHDMFMMGWSGSGDPNNSIMGLLEEGSASNYTFTANPKINEMLKKGRSLPNGDERKQLYADLQAYINEWCPMIFLNNDETLAGTRKNVHDMVIMPMSNHNFRTVYIGDN